MIGMKCVGGSERYEGGSGRVGVGVVVGGWEWEGGSGGWEWDVGVGGWKREWEGGSGRCRVESKRYEGTAIYHMQSSGCRLVVEAVYVAVVSSPTKFKIFTTVEAWPESSSTPEGIVPETTLTEKDSVPSEVSASL